MGRLTDAQLLEVVRTIETSGYWTWEQPDVAIDLPEDLSVACVGNRRVRRRETVWLRPMSPGQRMTRYLLDLPRERSESTRAPEDWIRWFKQ